jgi:predicted urease superfamily metal-dependent hydrolase
MNNIIRKLTSRKFWAAVVGFVTGLLIYFGKTAEQADQIAALIMSGASVIAYIIGEGMADAAGASGDNYYLPEEKPPEIDDK